LTKLKVKEVLLNHPIGEGKEPWPVSTEALQDDSSDEMANLKAAKEPLSPVNPEKNQDKKDENNDVPAQKVTEVKKPKKEVAQKEPTPKVIAKNKTKAKKASKQEDITKVDEESPSNTIEWDLSNDKSSDKSNESDENDQMTLF